MADRIDFDSEGSTGVELLNDTSADIDRYSGIITVGGIDLLAHQTIAKDTADMFQFRVPYLTRVVHFDVALIAALDMGDDVLVGGKKLGVAIPFTGDATPISAPVAAKAGAKAVRVLCVP